MRKSVLTLVAVLFPLSFAWSADIVFRKGTTTRIGGEFKSQTKEELVLMSGPGNKKEEKIPANEVLRVEWDGEPASMKLARSAEERGNLQDALTKYQEVASEVQAAQANLKTDLEFLLARVTAKMAKGDPAKVDEAVQKLDAYRTAHANSFRHYDVLLLLGETYLAKGDYANAEPAFKELEQAPWDDYKMASRIAQGRLALRKNDVAAAESLFKTVADQPAKTDAEKARQYEARLGVATCLQRQSKFQEAARELDEIIKLAPATDIKTMGEAYLRKGDNLLAAGEKKAALLAYLHVDVLFSAEKDLHAEALYHLSTLWNEANQPGRAADARVKLSADYPNSEWTKRLSGG
jgi:tetratricopeptide (TPR) repeat protein